MKRKLSMLLALCLVLSALAGAGWADADAEAAAAASELEPITFDVFINGQTNDWNGWGNDPVSAEFTRRTGVSLNVSTATTTDNAQLNGMVAAGTLPDIIVYGNDSPLRPMLWKQGFVQPLNLLMDEYVPEMWDVLPTDMDKVYSEEDGNFYMFVQYYSDVEKIAKIPGINATIAGFTLNMDMYEQLGSPALDTLEQYTEVLRQAKEQFPDVSYYAFDHMSNTPSDQRNMAQLINRIYGGGNVNSIAADDTVHLNFRDDTYKSALLYINSLYREGLFNPENFTITTDEQLNEAVKSNKIFSSWGQPFMVYKWNANNERPYQPAQFPTIEGIPMTLTSVATTIGYSGASITANCKDAKRAIEFFNYYYTDEGQMLMYHGIEGKDYELVDGMPKNLPEKAALWAENFSNMQKVTGIINYNLCFAVTNWADMMYYYWMNQDNMNYLLESELYNSLAVNERLNTLIQVPSDSEFKIIETKVMDLWKTSLPKLYLAESEQQCISAYDEFIAQAERLGLNELEAEYTRVYLGWKEKMQ